MATSFRLISLPIERFSTFFPLDDEELAAHGARRQIVDKKPGFPCRVSLMDAEPGERVILLPFMHHKVESPYRGSGPIYVREKAERAYPKVNEVPEMIRRRLLSLRAYDAAGMMLDAELAEGSAFEKHVRDFFADAYVAYLHVHNARPGCYNCRVDRA